MTYRNLIILWLASLIVCSCKKSKEAEYDAWAEKATTVGQSALTNWATTNGVNLQTSNQISGMTDALAKSLKSDVAKEISIQTAEAGQFLLQLHEKNRLPGVSKDEHGQIDSEVVPVMVSNKLVVAAYPMERIFHIVKTDYTSTNNYIVLKESKDAEWKLQRAWETDSKGQTIQEWALQ